MNIGKKVACSVVLAAAAILAVSSPEMSSAWAHCNDWQDGPGYWNNPGYQRAYYSNNGGLLSSIFGGGGNYYRPRPRWDGYRGYGWGPPPNAYRYYHHEHHHHHHWERDWDRDGDGD